MVTHGGREYSSGVCDVPDVEEVDHHEIDGGGFLKEPCNGGSVVAVC